MSKTHYDTLGIAPDADYDTIKQAAQLKIKQIKQIYTVLGDPQKRKVYDAELQTQDSPLLVDVNPAQEIPDARRHVNVLPEKKPTKPLTIQSIALRDIIRHSAYWFYWIALFSLMNSAILYLGGHPHIIIGLGITQLTETLGKQLIDLYEYIGIILDVLIAFIFIIIGFFAAKGQKSAFSFGILLYLLDGTLFWFIPPQPNLLAIGFHLFVLFWIYNGLRACIVDSTSYSSQ